MPCSGCSALHGVNLNLRRKKRHTKQHCCEALVWRRYIDIFMVWDHEKEELQKFLDAPNCYHLTLKSTPGHKYIFRMLVNLLLFIVMYSLIYLLIYLCTFLMSGPIRSGGSRFGCFCNPGVMRVEELS